MIVSVESKEERAPPQAWSPTSTHLLVASRCSWNVLNKCGEERLWEVVRDRVLGRGNPSLLSLARKSCSLTLVPGTFWAFFNPY